MAIKLVKTIKLIPACLAILLFSLFFHSYSVLAQDQMAIAPADQETTNHLFPKDVAGLPIHSFLHSKAYKHVLEKNIIAYEKKFGPCASPRFAGRVDVARSKIPKSFPEAGLIPQWIEIIKIEGCDKPFNRFVLVGVINDVPTFHPMLSGNALSLLDMVVEKDVLATLMESEHKHASISGCQKADMIRIHDAQLLSHKQEGETLYWNEVWHISNCKDFKKLTIRFETNPRTGTQFSIHQPEVVNKSVKMQLPTKTNVSE
ncbi:MAG: hypothetical protein AAF228_13425 [Pseudomonadota bacterium]